MTSTEKVWLKPRSEWRDPQSVRRDERIAKLEKSPTGRAGLTEAWKATGYVSSDALVKIEKDVEWIRSVNAEHARRASRTPAQVMRELESAEKQRLANVAEEAAKNTWFNRLLCRLRLV